LFIDEVEEARLGSAQQHRSFSRWRSLSAKPSAGKPAGREMEDEATDCQVITIFDDP